MKTSLAARATAFGLAAFVTVALLGSVDLLASAEAGAQAVLAAAGTTQA
ncbi:hypothetical protein ACPOLB_06990 [Rubrivivax sp. RP6-9]